MNEAILLQRSSATWTSQTAADVHAFYEATGKCVNAIRESKRRGDWDNAVYWLNVLMAGKQQAQEEPFAGHYGFAKACALSTMADWEASFVPGGGYSRLAAAWRILDARDLRRQQLGLSHGNATEARLSVLGVLAQLKWQDLGSMRNEVMPVQDMLDYFSLHLERVEDARSKHGGEMPDVVLRIVNLALVYGCELLILLMRYQPESVASLLSRLNALASAQSGRPLLLFVPLDFAVGQLPAGRPLVYWRWEWGKLYVVLLCNKYPQSAMNQSVIDDCFVPYRNLLAAAGDAVEIAEADRQYDRACALLRVNRLQVVAA